MSVAATRSAEDVRRGMRERQWMLYDAVCNIKTIDVVRGMWGGMPR